ncbi:MAG: phosphoribosylformylglycinamidine synthase subunit PurL, partial [Syntrophomonadaceae bacterium]|nr:phosphoribosylformylglycinamidine synthase subunit PurL [Syntrophomonadaceae bacterium]
HPSYEGNPLVNVMCVGLIEQRKLARGAASGVGNPVMVVGARTGRDGIHGATFASEELNETSEERRPAVQVGDPFMEKLLIESCLEVIEKGYVVGMQDLGAAGLTSSTCEMASRAETGIEVDVSKVPLRETGMTPYEIMLSESQERMLLVPKQGCEEAVREVFERWGLTAVVIGRVTDDGIFRIRNKDQIVAELPVRLLTEECPVYQRAEKEPSYYQELRSFNLESVPEPSDYNQVLLRIMASPNIADKQWVYRQYDHQVGINTVIVPGAGDAAVLRLKEHPPKGIALKTDCNSRYVYLDPYRGGALAVAEATRNLSCVGAEPLAITDCLNFGNPEKPEVFWQFKQAVLGMSEACRVLATPVVSGNVSFYNETPGRIINPTPTVGAVGLLEDVELRCSQGFKQEGDQVFLLGPYPESIGASEYLSLVHGLEAGPVPEPDLLLERLVQETCRQLIREKLINSAHDLSEGGMAVALAESCISGGIGVEVAVVDYADQQRLDAVLFGEGPARIIISVCPNAVERVVQFCREKGAPLFKVGQVGGQSLRIEIRGREVINLPLASVEQAWRGGISRWLNRL